MSLAREINSAVLPAIAIVLMQPIAHEPAFVVGSLYFWLIDFSLSSSSKELFEVTLIALFASPTSSHFPLLCHSTLM
jgi:hypothetical protein